MHKKNLKIRQKENSVTINVNSQIYPLDVIYSAAYVFLDRCYILLDGNPKKRISVTLKPKKTEEEFGKVAGEFSNELLNYAFYKKQAEKTSTIRQSIVQRALITNEGDILSKNSGKEIRYAKDKRGIAKPWKKNDKRI